MKQKFLSGLLALSMLLSVLSVGTIPAAAADTTLHAYQMEVSRPLTLDGTPDEPQWLIESRVGSTSCIGVLCDPFTLYLALETTQSSATLTINGVQVKATLKSGVTVTTGRIAAGEGTYEIAIPLSDLGITFEKGKTVPMTAKLGIASASFSLVLGAQGIVKTGNGYSLNGYDLFYAQRSSSSSLFPSKSCYVNSEGTVVFDYSGTSSDTFYAPTYVPATKFGSNGFTMSFEADFTALPIRNSASARNPAQFGLFWFICDGTNRYDMSFWADANKQIMFSSYLPSTASALSASIPTGLTVGSSAAKNLKVRIMTNAAGDVSLYINGELKGTVAGSRYASTTGAQIRFYAFTQEALSSAVSAELRDFSLREYTLGTIPTQSYGGSAQYAAGTSTAAQNVTAYLNSPGIVANGHLSEDQWYLPCVTAAKSGSAPAAARMGFLWDTDNLYAGIQTFSSSPVNSLQLTLNGKAFTATPSTGVASAGKLAAGFQQYEWAIPLSEIGLSPLSGSSFAYSLNVYNESNLGISTANGTVTLSNQTVILGENCDSIANRDYIFTNATHTTISQGSNYVSFYAPSSFTSGNEIAEYSKEVNYDGTGYELSFDLTVNDLPYFSTSRRGNRGWCIEIREGGDDHSPEFLTRFCLRSAKGGKSVYMDVKYSEGLTYEVADTGIDMGQRAQFKIVVTDEKVPVLYVNGKHIFTFPQLCTTWYNVADLLPMPRITLQATNSNRSKADDGKTHVVNVQMHDFLWTQTKDSALGSLILSSLDEKAILAGNSADNLRTNLNLPTSVCAPGSTKSYPITWSVSDANSGQRLTRINTVTGQVMTGNDSADIALTATIDADGAPASRTFYFQVKGKTTGKVAFIEGDLDPRTGRTTRFNRTEFVWIDGNFNSLVYDQGSSKPFNRITLHDSDKFSRAGVNHFGVFISDDNKTFTKVTGWQLHQDGSVYTLYNLNETARYVKVHSYQDSVDTVEWQPSFRNAIQSAITVSYETDLLGATGEFAHSVSFTAQNETAKEQKDVPVYITLAELGAKDGEYRFDAADFRFVMGETLLAHWYDGKAGFFVRIPSIPANGSAALTAYWGNPSAKNISDGEATFEVKYGNVICHNFTQSTAAAPLVYGRPDSNAIAYDARSFTFPNGDVMIMGTHSNSRLCYCISRDGGRTFSDPKFFVDHTAADTAKYGSAKDMGVGSYLWDPNINRLWVVGSTFFVAYDKTSKANSDARLCLFYSDDMGETWSTADRRYMSIQSRTPIAANDIIFQNDKDRTYMVTYCEGLTLKDCDYDGPNVDYVFMHGMQADDNGGFEAASIYSKDGGKTWWHSENTISMSTEKVGVEYGISETGLAQLDDGSLYIVARAQDDANTYLYHARSYDYGATWVEIGPSEIISSNTSPILAKYGDVRLLAWAGHNSLGGNARQRLPMSLGISYDEYKTYDKFLNLTQGTSLDSVKDLTRRISQPSLSFSPDGNEAFVGWSNLKGRPYYSTSTAAQAFHRTAEGFLIEEFDEMIFGTKGAYDDFESTALHSEGWLSDVGQIMTLATDRGATGERSLKLSDTGTLPAYAIRPIPSVTGGSIGASIYVPSGNTTDFVMELKAAYNYTYLQHTITGFGITPSGNVFTVHDSGKTVVGKVNLDCWNQFSIRFDMSTGKGVLLINGAAVTQLKLMDKGNEVSAVQFSAPTKSETAGSVLYADDFFVTEGAGLHNPSSLSFTDVPMDAWYYDAVRFVVDNQLMSGYDVTTFAPEDTLSRAMVVQVLYNKEGQPSVSSVSSKFPDVTTDRWYNNAVTWAAGKGVVGGYGDGTFAPERSMTLEEAAVILWNYSGNPTASGSSGDMGAHSDWAANALLWCASEGILDGIPYEAVTQQATRAQTAQMLMNYLNS